jgi:hypothetical protein
MFPEFSADRQGMEQWTSIRENETKLKTKESRVLKDPHPAHCFRY